MLMSVERCFIATVASRDLLELTSLNPMTPSRVLLFLGRGTPVILYFSRTHGGVSFSSQPPRLGPRLVSAVTRCAS